MSVDPQILALLACPESHQPLQQADEALISQINDRIAAGEAQSHSGQVVKAPLSEGLVRADGKCVYRVDDGIPNLLMDDRIDL